MQTVAHAGVLIRRLNDRDIAVTVVISGYCAVENAESLNLAAVETNYLVAVIRFSSISVVHSISPFVIENIAFIRSGNICRNSSLGSSIGFIVINPRRSRLRSDVMTPSECCLRRSHVAIDLPEISPAFASLITAKI
jgi:hypothetical protein